MNVLKIFVIGIVFFAACKSEDDKPALPDIAFDKSKWQVKQDDGNYAYRKQMVNDLLKNYQWNGIKRDSVERMLGKPDVYEPAEDLLMYYYDNGSGSMFSGTQSLVFELAPDSTVKKARYSSGGFD